MPVSNLISKFRESSIGLSVAGGKIYDETTTFNEQNINEYLAEVEEYIKCLLTMTAKSLGEEHPMLSALGLNELPKKIDPPVLTKDPIFAEEDEEEPSDAILNDMLDNTKFSVMISSLYAKKKDDASKSMALESLANKIEDSHVEESKLFL